MPDPYNREQRRTNPQDPYYRPQQDQGQGGNAFLDFLWNLSRGEIRGANGQSRYLPWAVFQGNFPAGQGGQRGVSSPPRVTESEYRNDQFRNSYDRDADIQRWNPGGSSVGFEGTSPNFGDTPRPPTSGNSGQRAAPTNQLELLAIVDDELLTLNKQILETQDLRERQRLSARAEQLTTQRGELAAGVDSNNLASYNALVADRFTQAQIDNAAAQTGLTRETIANQYDINLRQIDARANEFGQTLNQAREQLNWQGGQNAADRQNQLDQLMINSGVQIYGIDRRAESDRYNTDSQERTTRYTADRQYDLGMYNTNTQAETNRYTVDQNRGMNSDNLNYQYWQTGEGRQEAALGRRYQERMTYVQAELNKASQQMQNEFNMQLAQMENEIARGRLSVEEANQRLNEFATKRGLELQEGAMRQADDRFNKSLGENARQYDASRGDRRYEFDTSLGEGRRQYDLTRGDRRYEFDTGLGEGRRQFDLGFGEGRRQFDERLGFDREALNKGYNFQGQRDARGDIMALYARDLSVKGVNDDEYTMGGGPGGSISSMLTAFGNRRANPQGYKKQTIDYEKIADLAKKTSDKYTGAQGAFMSMLGGR